MALPPPLKKAKTKEAEAPKTSAAGAQAPPPQPLSITALLEMDSLQDHDAYMAKWAAEMKAYVDHTLLKFLTEHQQKVAFTVPSSLLLIPPLEITSAASGAHLSAFREVMNYENLLRSFSQSGQYEAAGTIWMLDAIRDLHSDGITISQLERAMWMWSEEAFLLSATQPGNRRYSFDVPLPAKVEDVKVAQRKEADKSTVVMAQPLPMLAGRALVIAWHGAIGEALRGAEEERVFRLFEAALSVPIRLRLCSDEDSCQVVSLFFSESLFASSAASGADSFWKFAEKVGRLSGVAKAIVENASGPKLTAALKPYGLTFKGKALTEANVKALKSLAPFVGDAACGMSYSLVESFCPELREATLLMRIAQLATARAASSAMERTASARASLVFVFDCLRMYRLTGDCPDVYTVNKVTGQEKKTPAMVHTLFKKQEIIEYVMHEFALMDSSLMASVGMFRTPVTLLKHFSASGEGGLVAAFRRSDSAVTEDFETKYAVSVADYRDRDTHDSKTQALIDFMWGVWSSKFDEEIMDLCCQDMQNTHHFPLASLFAGEHEGNWRQVPCVCRRLRQRPHPDGFCWAACGRFGAR